MRSGWKSWVWTVVRGGALVGKLCGKGARHEQERKYFECWKFSACFWIRCLFAAALPAGLSPAASANSGWAYGITWNYTVSGGEASIAKSNYTGECIIPSQLGGYPVTSIGERAFEYCSGVTGVTIPSSVTNIGVQAFYHCGLTNLVIPPSVTSIGAGAFARCKLEGIEVDTGNSQYESVGGVLFTKGERMLLQYPQKRGGSYAIPNSVTSILAEAFSLCTNLTSVTIPDGVTRIEELTFFNCNGLTNVTIGNGVTTIGKNAFWLCDDLESVTIGNSVTDIGEYAFSGCYSWDSSNGLRSVTIPNSVTNIGRAAFLGCAALTNVTIGNRVKLLGRQAFGTCSSLTCLTIPDSVTRIEGAAFMYCSGLTNVTIGNGVTDIVWDVFAECYSLRSVTIPNSVANIGESAFFACFALTNALIGNGVTNIGRTAFYSNALTNVTIPYGVTSIGNEAFAGCLFLTNATIANSAATLGTNVFSGSKLQLLVVPLAWEETDKLASAGVPDECTVLYQLDFAITPTNRHFGVAGGGGAVNTSGNGTWKATASEGWITLKSSTGQAGLPVVYTVDATSDVEIRTGTIDISGHLHTVTQDGRKASISPESATFERTGGTGTISVDGPDTIGWKAQANDSWLGVSPSSGTGPGTVTYTVAALDEVATRQGTLTVAGNTFTVFQTGLRMRLASSTSTQDYREHEISVAVEALASTEWAAMSNAGWITVVDAGTGKGNGVVKMAVAENPSWEGRTGTVKIGTETFTVTQTGRTALVFNISPASATVEATREAGSIAVTATPDLPWSAESQADWLTLNVQAARGAGNGTVSYTAAANPALDARTGKVTVTPGDTKVGAKTHTVTQLAAASELSLGGYEFEADGESCEVRVSVADIVQWNIENKVSWLTVSGATNRVGPATLTLQAEANDTAQPRSGTVTIARKTFKVTQKARGVEVEYETKLFGAEGGYETVAVHPDGNLSWTAVSSDPVMLTIFDGESGTGDGQITYVVSPCGENAEARTATITVGNKVIYITQRPYDLSIDPVGMWVPGGNGEGEFRVMAEAGLAWRAIATESWIAFADNCDAGAGSGTVRFRCEDNETGKTRTGKIIVAGEVFTVEQRVRQQGTFPNAEDVIDVADALSGAADKRLGERIGSVEAYDAFRAWMAEKGLDPQVVKESPHAWISYALGAEKLFGVEPTLHIDGLAIGLDGDKNEGRRAMEVDVTVQDGEKGVCVDAGIIAGMFEATGDLCNWTGQSRLFASASQTGSEGETMQFKVIPGDGTNRVAFLRLALPQGKSLQTIFFAPIGTTTWQDRKKLSATASSGGKVVFEVVSGPGVVEEGDVLSFTGPGTVVVRALQGGDNRWLPASASQAVEVEKARQTMSFSVVDTQSWQAHVSLWAMASSEGGVTFEVVSGPGKIEGNVLSFTGVGTVEVRAVQAGDERWLPVSATQVVQAKFEQTIAFASIGETNVFGHVELSATASSGGKVAFEVLSGPGKIERNVLSFTGVGDVVVRAVQAGNEQWLPATATQTVAVVADLYMVLDLSEGADATSYPVTFATQGGYNNSVYKRTKLVLRRIDPGTFTMMDNQVILSRPYYIGVFEVTQKQYELVKGQNPSSVRNLGDSNPVDTVSWWSIRGETNWPVSSAISADSFMGRLRARTALAFDLPTEAQWEYACRAGTTTDLNNGKNLSSGDYCTNLVEVGWYEENAEGRTHPVGNKLPNAWGLYDMHGNVCEWCLDWWSDEYWNPIYWPYGITDPVGPSGGWHRVVRGGTFAGPKYWCTSSHRSHADDSDAGNACGFRVVVNLPQ